MNDRVGLFIKQAYLSYFNDLTLAAVLSQIQYWYTPSKQEQEKMPYGPWRSKLRIKRDGHFWIKKSYREWWEETRLTRKSIDRALSALENLGLIERKVLRYDGHGTSHVRLVCAIGDSAILWETDLLVQLIAPSMPPEALPPTPSMSKWTPLVCPNGHTKNVPKGHSITDITAENIADNTLATPKDGDEMKLQKNRKGPLRADQVISSLPKPTPYTPSVEGMYRAWQVEIPKHHPEIKFMAPLGVKHKAQIKRIASLWGDDALDVLLSIIKYWTDFAKFVKVQVGAREYPRSPNLDYLTKHLGMAKSFVMAQGGNSQEPAKEVQLTAQGGMRRIGNVVIRRKPVQDILEDVGLEEVSEDIKDQSHEESAITLEDLLKYRSMI